MNVFVAKMLDRSAKKWYNNQALETRDLGKATGRMREGKRTKRIRSGLSKNESQRKNFEKLSKNLLTNGTESGIIIKRLKMRVQKIPTGRKPMGERNGFRSLSRNLRKNFKKLFENPLTSERICGIIYRLSQRDGTERHGDSPDGL